MKKPRITNTLKGAMLIGAVGAIAWVIAGLPGTWNPDLQPPGYVGQPAVSSHVLYTGGTASLRTRLYAIDYDSNDWSGNLHSYPLSSTGSVVKTDDWGTSVTPPGGAALVIDNQSPADSRTTGRKIFTFDTTVSPKVGRQFRFKVDTGKGAMEKLPDAYITLLGPNDEEKKIKFIRGERTEEGKAFRARSTVLGDIIHSTPVYCDSTDCATGSTAGTVFVGANDGMLHAINAADGSERFAYIPSMLMSKLATIGDDPYTHKFYVDGRMDLRKFGSQTILAGGLGAGGIGIWALDVTAANPADEVAAKTKVLWEITNTTPGNQFLNLGYTYGQPVMAKLAGGTNALVMANGYGNSGNFKASLYIINAVTGAWVQELVTTDSTPSTTNRNGLSSPTLVDQDGDGTADVAYAGDLNGNLWKFLLVSPWTVTKLCLTSANDACATTTNPAQPITMQPGVVEHPKGGFMVTFVTGRMLTPEDSTDATRYVAYGIWDGAPASNTTALNQTLTERDYGSGSTAIRVRTATNYAPDWSAGHHKGWRTELPIDGERVVGDGAYISGGVFQFMSTNPTIAPDPGFPEGENWWMQLNAYTGGDVGSIRFDLNGSASFTVADQVSVGGVLTSPVGRNMGPGRRSQLTAIAAGSQTVYQSNYDKNAGEPPTPDNGISGGHFDFDIYYHQSSGTVYTASASTSTGKTGAEPPVGSTPVCLKTTDVNNVLNEITTNYCKTANPYGMPAGYTFLAQITTGAKCGDPKQPTYAQTLTCAIPVANPAGASYSKKLHVHEYDDKYNVTGVNMLHPSDAGFKINTMKGLVDTPTQGFKILVMNQFLNPAALLRVGHVGETTSEVSVKTYGSLASQTDPSVLLSGLPTYTLSAGANQLGTLIYNLPKTAFQSKDWWGSGGDGLARSGLIPTQTGCVNGVSGTSVGDTGPQGERFNGALGFQIIKDTTPASALELNVPGDVRYGWRVKAGTDFPLYVIGEYSTFWHHFNGKCYGQAGWVRNPPQDAPTSAAASAGDAGADDPKGLFGGPGTPGDPTVVSQVQVTVGGETVTRTTYSDGTVVDTYADGRTKTTTTDSGGVQHITWTIPGVDTGGVVNTNGGGGTNEADPGGVRAPGETPGRINWRELRR